MPPLINPLPLIFTLATTFGVLVHDMQIDRATLAAVVPVAFVSFAAVDALTKSGEHVHVERSHGPNSMASLRMNIPRIQPRDDDRRYIQTKKLYLGASDTVSLWPSV